jgi:hypothetical protein
MGRLCEELNHILVAGIWHDKFAIQNTNWLWLMNDDVADMNSDKLLCGVFWMYPSYKLLCGVFGMYPSFVAGILNSGGEINFCVLCNEKLKYSDYI